MAFDPTASGAKWKTRLQTAAGDGTIQRGVGAVTVAPGQAAARQKAVWLANVQASQDRWAANTAAVSLPDWQSAMTAKALPRIQALDDASQTKMVAFLTKLAPVIQNAVNSLPPRGTFQQNLARSQAMATALHNAKGSFK